MRGEDLAQMAESCSIQYRRTDIGWHTTGNALADNRRLLVEVAEPDTQAGGIESVHHRPDGNDMHLRNRANGNPGLRDNGFGQL